MDKRFPLVFLIFFKPSALNAVILLWRRKADLASEQKLGGFVVSLPGAAKDFQAGLVVDSLF